MRLDLRRDGTVLMLLALMLVMLGAALTGTYRVFGYALVALLGALMTLGFGRRGDPVTLVPPVLATTVLLVAFSGMFATEQTLVLSARDTVLGFQPGTAFLVYGVWIPAFFTVGIGFAAVFNRIMAADDRADQQERPL